MTWVLFDLNGTLLDPRTIDRALPDGNGVASKALGTAVLFSMALAHVSEYRPFADLVRSALRRELELAGMPEQLDRAVDAAGRLEPFPDAAAALDVLAGAGCRLGVLTNSEGSAAEGNLTRVGWRDRFERVIGTEQVRAYKPRPELYRRALEELEARSDEVWLVTAHGWDALGARHAGLSSAWVSRREGVLLDVVPEPDVRAEDLRGAAAGMVNAFRGAVPAG